MLLRCLWPVLRLCAVLLLAAGCATGPDRDPRDPLEPMNRAITRFNDVAEIYRTKRNIVERLRHSPQIHAFLHGFEDSSTAERA